MPKEIAVKLESEMTISKSEGLHSSLIATFEQSVEDSRGIAIDASEVERIDSSCLQLLYALFRDLEARDLNLNWKKPSESFIQSAQLLGLSEHMGLES